jgi:hypothetical protein
LGTKTEGIPDSLNQTAPHISGGGSISIYAPEASTGFRLTNNSMAFPSIDELKENLSV